MGWIGDEPLIQPSRHRHGGFAVNPLSSDFESCLPLTNRKP
jgi:hypothetical protein